MGRNANLPVRVLTLLDAGVSQSEAAAYHTGFPNRQPVTGVAVTLNPIECLEDHETVYKSDS